MIVCHVSAFVRVCVGGGGWGGVGVCGCDTNGKDLHSVSDELNISSCALLFTLNE